MSNSQAKIEIVRHSLAHLMASAVSQLYPGVKFGIGPAIENGFYYDFDFSNVILREAASRPKDLGRDSSATPQNDNEKITPKNHIKPQTKKSIVEIINNGLIKSS